MLLSTVRPAVLAARRARNRLLSAVGKPVVVLLYHRVTTLSSDPQLLAVSPENFRNQMRYLKDRFPLVRFEDDWSHLKSLSIAVTFDDGYADNVLNALPILEELGIPATFFVSTGNLDTHYEYWWDELERIVLGNLDLPETFILNDGSLVRRWSTKSSFEREKLYEELQPLMKKLTVTKREEWLGQLRRWAVTGENGRGSHRSMTREQLLRLARSSWVTIGAHSVSHARLSALAEPQQREEIFSSRQQLQNLLGTAITTFAYPYGRKDDYNLTSIKLCREAGFLKVASNFPGMAYRWTDTMQVPRYLVRDWNLEEFDTMLREFGVP